MKYLRYFKTSGEYTPPTVLPNVSYIVETKDVNFAPKVLEMIYFSVDYNFNDYNGRWNYFGYDGMTWNDWLSWFNQSYWYDEETGEYHYSDCACDKHYPIFEEYELGIKMDEINSHIELDNGGSPVNEKELLPEKTWYNSGGSVGCDWYINICYMDGTPVNINDKIIKNYEYKAIY